MNLQENVMKSPSYIHSLLNKSEDIILVYKFKENDKSFISSPRRKIMPDNSLDITGSPLKVDLDNSSIISMNLINDCNNFWQQQEENYASISYKEAQKFIESYWSKNHNSLNPLPVWCVCDGEDEQKILLVSAVQTRTHISRCLVTRNGYLPKNHCSITFEALCNKHFDTIRKLTGEKQKVPLRQLTTDVSSTYELFGSKITQTKFDNMNIPGSVYLEVNWNLCCADIPRDNSKSVMTIQTIVGQDSSVMYRFWKELILLELFIKALADYSSKQGLINNDWWLPGKFDVNKNFDFNEEIIETINNCYKQRYNTEKDVKKILQIVENIDNRYTYDITDRLWNILSKCSNYGGLKDCLNVVFNEIAQRDNEIFIADTNHSIMAQMIEDIVARKLPLLVLTGTQPIEILIDIGLEKLRKDFVFIYKEFDICPEQELNEIFNELFRKANGADLTSNIKDISRKNILTSLYNKKSFTSCEYLEDRIKVLGQMHTALETLILVPTQWQAVSLKYIYEHFVGNDNVFDCFATLAQKKLYEIEIKLPVSEIYEYIKKLNPVMWRLSLTLSRPNYSVQSVFHLAQRPIFPPCIYPHDMMDSTSFIAENDIYYHFTHLTNVKNFIQTKLVKKSK